MKLMNVICICLGFLCLVMGMLGIVLPVLPTTPFLLLTVFFFAKGSEKFHAWFCTTALHQKYVDPAIKKKGMDKATKCKAMITLGIIFAISFLIIPVWYGKLVVLIVALCHLYYFLFKIKTIPASEG